MVRGGRRESDGHEHHAEPDEPVAMVPRNVVRSWRVAYVEDEADAQDRPVSRLRGASVTTPVDPVEALAKGLSDLRLRRVCDCGQAGSSLHRGYCNSFALARAALAHARGLVPEVEELAQIISGCDPDKWPAFINHYDAWSESYRRTARRVRADTLRRLGGGGA